MTRRLEKVNSPPNCRLGRVFSTSGRHVSDGIANNLVPPSCSILPGFSTVSETTVSQTVLGTYPVGPEGSLLCTGMVVDYLIW